MRIVSATCANACVSLAGNGTAAADITDPATLVCATAAITSAHAATAIDARSPFRRNRPRPWRPLSSRSVVLRPAAATRLVARRPAATAERAAVPTARLTAFGVRPSFATHAGGAILVAALLAEAVFAATAFGAAAFGDANWADIDLIGTDWPDALAADARRTAELPS